MFTLLDLVVVVVVVVVVVAGGRMRRRCCGGCDEPEGGDAALLLLREGEVGLTRSTAFLEPLASRWSRLICPTTDTSAGEEAEVEDEDEDEDEDEEDGASCSWSLFAHSAKNNSASDLVLKPLYLLGLRLFT